MKWVIVILLLQAASTLPTIIAVQENNNNQIDLYDYPTLSLSSSEDFSPSTPNCTETTDPRVRQLVIKLALSLSKNGDYEGAKQELTQFNSNYTTELAAVIDQLYNGSLSNTIHCLELFAVTECDTYDLERDALIQKMDDYGRLDDPEETLIVVLTLAGLSGVCNLTDSVHKLKPQVDKILDQWSVDILNGTNDHIYDFDRAHWDSFRFHLDSLISRVYALNAENATSALQTFVEGLPWLADTGLSYVSITQQLSESGRNHSEEMLIVAHDLHACMVPNADDIANETVSTEAFAKARDNVPSEISNLFWKSNCTIINLFWDEEALFALGSASKENGGNGAVFTAESGQVEWESMWTLNSYKEAEKVYFVVRNKFLIGESENFDLCESIANGGKPVTCGEDEQGHRRWYIEPAVFNGTVDAFLIKNSELGNGVDDYLLATNEIDDSGVGRRELWDGPNAVSSFWKIDCV